MTAVQTVSCGSRRSDGDHLSHALRVFLTGDDVRAGQVIGATDKLDWKVPADVLDMLSHCFDEKQVQVRGCWVVDFVLGTG